MSCATPSGGLLVAVALATALATPGDTRGQTVRIDGQERSVLAEATALSAAGADAQSDEDFAADASPFVGAAQAAADIGEVVGSAGADQDSSLGATGVAASGQASAQASVLGGTVPVGTFAAESFFDVLFTPEARAGFELDGTLSASTADAGDGFASLELLRGDAVVVSREVALAGSEIFATSGDLDAGVAYRLRVFALATALVDGAEAAAQGGASFDVELRVVPEPTTAAGAAAVAATLAGLARRRRLLRGGGR